MQTPVAWYNEHAAYKAWIDGVAPGGIPMPYQAAQPALMGGAQYFLPHGPNAMIVAAPEDPPWPPAWIWPKDSTMKQIQGFCAAVLLFIALIFYRELRWVIWTGLVLGGFKILITAAVDNAVFNTKERLRGDGLLLSKPAANPVYNIVPLQM
jgi:hypothetical protein